MSLTKSDIREVFNEALEALVLPRFEEVDNRFEVVEDHFREADDHFIAQEKSFTTKIELESTATINHIRLLRGEVESAAAKIDTLQNDIKAIYRMISDLQKTERAVAKLGKDDLEKKIIKTYKELIAIARAEGITLPR